MPLPEGGSNQAWPPKPWASVYEVYREWAAWYGGDATELAKVYGGQVTKSRRSKWWKFWSRAGQQVSEHQTRSQLHVPMAADIASTSASLLFGEHPLVMIPEAHGEGANEEAKRAEDRLFEILEAGDAWSRISEAAESAAALGGVLIKVDWDSAVHPVPVLSVVQADQAMPEFRLGRLTAATLWRVVWVEGQSVWRHVERHEPGAILHGLYHGSTSHLGQLVPLDRIPETAGLRDVVPVPDKRLLIRYIPNMRPNRRVRGSWLGQSDFSGAEGLLDALDEVWTSWIREVRLAKARAFVPEDFLNRAGDSWTFDVDQEIFSPLDIPPGDSGGQITFVQPEIRFEAFERTMLNIVERIVTHAGYSPQTFGLQIEGRAESGTALRIRERKSLQTQQTKAGYWTSPLADLFELLLVIDREVFSSGVDPIRPQLTMSDSLVEGMGELAATLELITRAGAMSTEVKVQTLHPDWDDDRVQAEVQRLREEQGLAVPDAMQVGVA